MKWAHHINLIYRAYVLTTQDVTLQFMSIRDSLRARYGKRASFSNTDESRLPLREEDAITHRARGRLVVECVGKPWLVLREMRITVAAKDSEAAFGTLYEVLDDYPGTFAAMQVVSESLTEMVAV